MRRRLKQKAFLSASLFGNGRYFPNTDKSRVFFDIREPKVITIRILCAIYLRLSHFLTNKYIYIFIT